MNLKPLKYILPVVIGLGAVYLIAEGVCSNTTREQYKPEQLAADATDAQRGQVIANSVNFALEQELDTLFGWQLNDLFFVPSIFDNKAAYQAGVIYATRQASDVLAKTAARAGERDTIDPRLTAASGRYFAYGQDVWGFWFIYDCEGKYREGIKNWNDWAASINDGTKKAGVYNVRSDDVYEILKYASTVTELALSYLNSSSIGHFSADDAIYYAKGVVSVAGNVVRGLAAVDESVAVRGGQENLDEALKRFDYIAEFDPLYVFAGGNAVGDAMMPNHVAALARHVDIVNNRINDMLASMEK